MGCRYHDFINMGILSSYNICLYTNIQKVLKAHLQRVTVSAILCHVGCYLRQMSKSEVKLHPVYGESQLSGVRRTIDY